MVRVQRHPIKVKWRHDFLPQPANDELMGNKSIKTAIKKLSVSRENRNWMFQSFYDFLSSSFSSYNVFSFIFPLIIEIKLEGEEKKRQEEVRWRIIWLEGIVLMMMSVKMALKGKWENMEIRNQLWKWKMKKLCRF